MTSLGFFAPIASAQRTFAINMIAGGTAMQRLATGLRINRAADDPAGLISSENLRAQLEIIDAETRSMQRADSRASVADAALGEISYLLNNAEALAVSSANTGAMSDEEIAANQMQMDSIVTSIQRIADTTQFNGGKLLDGEAELSAAGESITIESAQPRDLGDGSNALADVVSGGSLSFASGDSAAIADVLAGARDQVNTMRGSIGAFQAHTIEPSISSNHETFKNTALALSVIRDTDYAFQTAEFTRASILSSASLSALSFAMGAREQSMSLLGY